MKQNRKGKDNEVRFKYEGNKERIFFWKGLSYRINYVIVYHSFQNFVVFKEKNMRFIVYV